MLDPQKCADVLQLQVSRWCLVLIRRQVIMLIAIFGSEVLEGMQTSLNLTTTFSVSSIKSSTFYVHLDSNKIMVRRYILLSPGAFSLCDFT